MNVKRIRLDVHFKQLRKEGFKELKYPLRYNQGFSDSESKYFIKQYDGLLEEIRKITPYAKKKNTLYCFSNSRYKLINLHKFKKMTGINREFGYEKIKSIAPHFHHKIQNVNFGMLFYFPYNKKNEVKTYSDYLISFHNDCRGGFRNKLVKYTENDKKMILRFAKNIYLQIKKIRCLDRHDCKIDKTKFSLSPSEFEKTLERDRVGTNYLRQPWQLAVEIAHKREGIYDFSLDTMQKYFPKKQKNL